MNRDLKNDILQNGLKVNDEVIVKSLDWFKTNYDLVTNGVNVLGFFSKSMTPNCGKKLVVETSRYNPDSNRKSIMFRVKENQFLWSVEMIDTVIRDGVSVNLNDDEIFISSLLDKDIDTLTREECIQLACELENLIITQ